MPIKNIGFPKSNDNVVIGDNEVGKNRKVVGYWCPSCNFSMFKSGEGEWTCSHCSHTEYTEENMAQTAEIPEPETLDNTEILAAVVPTNFDNMVSHVGQKPELKGGALALSKRGTIRFTSYTDSSVGKENAD
jgi:uncharacterized Zn finger protein (UPF0148 family)